jgi:hypothetical protein
MAQKTISRYCPPAEEWGVVGRSNVDISFKDDVTVILLPQYEVYLGLEKRPQARASVLWSTGRVRVSSFLQCILNCI